MTPIRVGVVGVGRLGAEHARILGAHPDFDLIGVHDLDGIRAVDVSAACSTRSFETAYRLAAECDAVVVAVSTSAHAEVATVCLERDCHTFVEKPLTRTVDEGAALVDLAERRGVVLGVGHVERFNGIVMACRPFLETPRFIESRRLAPFQLRGTDVTVILDLMIHDIDLVLGFVDRPLESVQAIGTSVMTGSVDMANARLRFEGGAVADISASRVSMKPLRQVRLYQETGYFSLDLAARRGIHLRRTDRAVAQAERVEDLFERIVLKAPDGEPLGREMDAFARAIRGEPSRLVTGQGGLQALEIAIRITREIEESAHVATQGS